MKVKICGIRDIPTALNAIEQGVDALGFVFADSKRRVTPREAKAIIEKLPKEVLKVGVFVNAELGEIQKIIEQTGLTAVQLHGDESPEYCEGLSVPVIKAVSVKSSLELSKIQEYPVEYILLDSPKGQYRGGNGTSFDWSLLKNFNRGQKKIILAGGLNEENVEEAIRIASPYMVDVSSGVETNGIKDPKKIQNFIGRAKN